VGFVVDRDEQIFEVPAFWEHCGVVELPVEAVGMALAVNRHGTAAGVNVDLAVVWTPRSKKATQR
jgi:hypothetical protein